jgi:hypothetical protein
MNPKMKLRIYFHICNQSAQATAPRSLSNAVKDLVSPSNERAVEKMA